MVSALRVLVVLVCVAALGRAQVEAADVTSGDPVVAAAEERFYPMVNVVIPWDINLEAVGFCQLPDGRLAVGTRRGEIYFVSGATNREAGSTKFERFASGLHEVFGLAEKDGVIYATQQCEVTKIRDVDGDGRADDFETLSDAWGFGGEHEYTFGSSFDRDGNLWVIHCLTGSYTSEFPFRGWAQRITPDGRTLPTCSGVRSPGGLGMNAAGDMFYAENQGPWNGACSLKHLAPGNFMGHPISFPWYAMAPELGPAPEVPVGGRDVRQHEVASRIPQLEVPAVVFPYRKMGQSATKLVLDDTAGRFGPFEGQLFVADYTLSLVMRVFLEQVNGQYQGACFPFRQGFKTGLLGLHMTREGQLFTGGCSRGWPARGPEPYALQYLEWNGTLPFEVKEMSARADGFALTFTKPVDPAIAASPSAYAMTSYTYRYQKEYGSPEVDHQTPTIKSVTLSDDRLHAHLTIDGLRVGYIHELALNLTAATGEPLLHPVAYYTLNALPTKPR